MQIISASRRTDIPAFFAEQFIADVRRGYTELSSPYGQRKVSFANAKLFVFWTKNPKPLIAYLGELSSLGYDYYFQFSLNNYESESWEPNLPSLDERIETFVSLSEQVSKQRVLWRFDPIIITSKLSPKEILSRIEHIGNQIHKHTTRLTFSFVDVYGKVKPTLNGLGIYGVNNAAQHYISRGIAELNKDWQLQLCTCAEPNSFAAYGIEHGSCIDPKLIAKLIGQHSLTKDTAQRKLCGCVKSVDIGSYRTCSHGCSYCYAN